jgi:hypothetical protein
LLFFAPYTFESVRVGLLVDEPAGVCVALHEAVATRIENLGPVPNRAFAVSVPLWWICGHVR